MDLRGIEKYNSRYGIVYGIVQIDGNPQWFRLTHDRTTKYNIRYTVIKTLEQLPQQSLTVTQI